MINPIPKNDNVKFQKVFSDKERKLVYFDSPGLNQKFQHYSR